LRREPILDEISTALLTFSAGIVFRSNPSSSHHRCALHLDRRTRQHLDENFAIKPECQEVPQVATLIR
jgi:hypothetical protein